MSNSNTNSDDYEDYIQAMISAIEDPDFNVTDSERFYGFMQALKRMNRIDNQAAKAVKSTFSKGSWSGTPKKLYSSDDEQKFVPVTPTSPCVKVGADFSETDQLAISDVVLDEISHTVDINLMTDLKIETDQLSLNPVVFIFFVAFWVQIGSPANINSINDLSRAATTNCPKFLSRVWQRNTVGVHATLQAILKYISNPNIPLESRDRKIDKVISQVFFLGVMDRLNFSSSVL